MQGEKQNGGEDKEVKERTVVKIATEGDREVRRNYNLIFISVMFCIIVFVIYAFYTKNARSSGLEEELIYKSFESYKKADNIKTTIDFNIEGTVSGTYINAEYILSHNIVGKNLYITSEDKSGANNSFIDGIDYYKYYVDEENVYFHSIDTDNHWVKQKFTNFYNGSKFDDVYYYPEINGFMEDAKFTKTANGYTVIQNIDYARFLSGIMDSDYLYNKFLESYSLQTLYGKDIETQCVTQTFKFDKNMTLISVEYDMKGNFKNINNDSISHLSVLIEYSSADKIDIPFNKDEVTTIADDNH